MKQIKEILESGASHRIYDILADLELDKSARIAALIIENDLEIEVNDEVNKLVSTLKELRQLDFMNTTENSYEDFRNLIVLISMDYRVIVIYLAMRLDYMRLNKKVELDDKELQGKITLKIFGPLAHRLGLGQIKTELEELGLYYYDLESFKLIVKKLEMKKSEREELLEKVLADIIPLIPFDDSEYKISARNKSIYSIYNKVKNRGETTLYDLQGVRIICNSIAECYTILGNIHENYPPLDSRYKDYITLKKPNLYQSLHTAIKIDGKNIVEIQIRTFEMHEIAEKGVAAHFLYKDEENKDLDDLEDQLHVFREVIENGVKATPEHDDMFKSVIYAYTPTGKIIFLPCGASIIDFAYRIHSKVADNMIGAYVNGEIKPVTSLVNSNDIIEIKTRNNAKSCNEEWLAHIKTTQAYKKIRSQLKQRELDKFKYEIENGKILLATMLKKDLIKTNLELEQLIIRLAKNFTANSRNDLFIAIYNKKITINDINELFVEKTREIKTFKVIDDETNLEAIIIEGSSGIKKEIAKCCKPVPGDEIVGLIHSGKSIRIHKTNCKNIQGSHKRIAAFWNANNESKYLTELEIHAISNQGVFTDIAAILAKDKVVLSEIKQSIISEQSTIKMKILVHNLGELEKIIGKLEMHKYIIYANRK